MQPMQKDAWLIIGVAPEQIMNKRKLDSYKGKLSADQIAAGINAAIQNAKRLASVMSHKFVA